MGNNTFEKVAPQAPKIPIEVSGKCPICVQHLAHIIKVNNSMTIKVMVENLKENDPYLTMYTTIKEEGKEPIEVGGGGLSIVACPFCGRRLRDVKL